MRTVIRPTFKPTKEQSDLMSRTKAAWKAATQAEEKAWQLTQALREADVPDTAMCEQIDELSRATLNRRLGPRPGRQAAE